MAQQLDRVDLHAGIEQRYPDNLTEQITPELLREGLHEIVDSAYILAADGGQLANVPLYVAGTPYGKGFTVRYPMPGGADAFYYSLKAGKLPPPSGTTDANWKVVPGPVSSTALSQSLSLLQAQGIQFDQVVAGRDYLIDFGNDAAGYQQTVTVRGISNNSFDVEGTLEVNGVITPITALDVFAGTYQVKGATSTTKSEVEAFSSFAAFPKTGLTDTLYIDTATGYQYYWVGTRYSKLSDSGLSANQIGGIRGNASLSASNPVLTFLDAEDFDYTFKYYDSRNNFSGTTQLTNNQIGSTYKYSLADNAVVNIDTPDINYIGRSIIIINAVSSAANKTITVNGRGLEQNQVSTLAILNPGDSIRLTIMVLPSGMGVGYATMISRLSVATSQPTASMALCQVAFVGGNGSQAIPPGQFVAMAFNSVEIDTANGWDAANNRYVVQPGQAGIYEVAFKARLDDNFPAGRGYGLGVDKMPQDSPRFAWQQSYHISDGGVRNGGQTGQILYELVPGDQLVAFGFANSGASFTLTNLLIKRIR